MIDFSRIDMFNRGLIKEISEDKLINEECEELWVFGSVVKGCSSKQHRPASDIDLAMIPVRGDSVKKVFHRLNEIAYMKYNKDYDLIVLDESDIKNNVLKGERLV